MAQLTEIQKVQRQILRQKRALPSNVGTLKKTLMYLDISKLTYEEWVLDRKNYIGGSDMATILKGNLNPYQSALELFHEKVGVVSKIPKESEATYAGHCAEDYVKNNYWVWHDMMDPSHETRMDNVQKGNNGKVRYCKGVKDFKMYDPRFPWIQINLDGFIQNTRFEKAPRGILECKSGLGYVWAEYEAGIPVFYIIQAQTYMLVTGIKYCEIAVLLDGRYFKVFPIEANKVIQETILEESKAFWAKVQEGRQIWEDPDIDESEKIQYLGQIEPPVDGSKALDKYLKERFRSDYKAGKMQINPTIMDISKEYLGCNKRQNKLVLEKTLYSNKLKKIFLDNKVDEMVNADGKVLVTNRVEGRKKEPTLRVNPDILKLDVAS